MFDMVDTAFMEEDWSSTNLQEFSKTKESSLCVI